MKSVNPRRAVVGINYNGKNVETSLVDYLETFSYKDVASGEGDTISIQLDNHEKKFYNEWMPVKGDQLVMQIKTYNWDGYNTNWNTENGMKVFKCGSFMLDEFGFSGRPLICTIKGISTPSNSTFKTTTRSKTWKNITIQEIAKEITTRAGISLYYNAGNIKLKSLEQSKQTDAEFISGLCKEYGLYIKIYSSKLVIYDPSKCDEAEAIVTIDEKDMLDWDWETATEGSYTGGKMQYTDASSEKDYTCEVGSGARILEVSGKADSKEDAKVKVRAAINLANRGITKMNVLIMANMKIVASSCIKISGLGKLNGKYFVDSVEHNVGSGYTMKLELGKIENKIY